jgi:hypothetical protein
MGNVKEIEIKAKMTDEEFKKNEGRHFDESDLDMIISEDADIYGLDIDKDGRPARHLLAKFRKNVFPKEEVQIGWDAFRTLAMPSRNRGAAAGPIDFKSAYWRKRKPIQTDKWATRYIEKGKISKMRVNNLVASGVIGFFEETPFMKAACRMTVYTRRYLHLYLHGLPYLQAIDKQFAKLNPKEHARQLAAVKAKRNYQIPGTAFSTVTVNLNMRTAVHKDGGDFKQGFGNLSVIEWGKYHGGYTMFPRFGVGFDVRTGDYISMDVHEWHCNSPMYETKEDKTYNLSIPDIRSRDPTSGLLGSEERFQRLTFVCYFRDKLQACDEKETEEYYSRSDFNEKEELAKAKTKPVKTLLLPTYNELANVELSVAALGKTYRQRLPGGGTRKMKNFMNKQSNARRKTRKN